MEKTYLIKKGKLLLGPFTLQALKEKQLKPSDLVWSEGLADWTPIDNLPEWNQQEDELKHSPKFSVVRMLRQLFAPSK